jgi:hypothetical protein
MRPVENSILPEAQSAAEGPASQLRPRAEAAVEPSATPAPVEPSPKHTFDAISLGEKPAPSTGRGRRAALVAAAVAIFGLGAIAKHVYLGAPGAHAVAAAVGAPLAPVEPAAPVAVAEGASAPVAPAATVAAAPSEDVPPTSADTTPAAPAKKHAKQPVHHRRGPAKTTTH